MSFCGKYLLMENRKKTLFLALLLFFIVGINLSFSDDSLEMDNIDVDGQYNQQQGQTAAERLKNHRAKLEKRSEQMVKKRIETIRYRKELELMKQMDKQMRKIMSDQFKALDKL